MQVAEMPERRVSGEENEVVRLQAVIEEIEGQLKDASDKEREELEAQLVIMREKLEATKRAEFEDAT